MKVNPSASDIPVELLGAEDDVDAGTDELAATLVASELIPDAAAKLVAGPVKDEVITAVRGGIVDVAEG